MTTQESGLVFQFIGNNILMLLFFSLLIGSWLIPFLYKYTIGQTNYLHWLHRMNIVEHDFGIITWEWKSFYKFLPKHLFKRSSTTTESSTDRFFQRLFNGSFSVGVVLSVVLSVCCALFLVCHLLYFPFSLTKMSESSRHVGSPSDEVENLSAPMMPDISMVMLIPGVNLPVHQLGLLFIALIVCVVVHEYGHAIAADYQDIKIDSFGFSIYYILPSAYVSMETESLERKSLFGRLMIFCGGVWHNILLCVFIAMILLVFFNPNVSYLAMIERPNGGGVIVKSVAKDNPLYNDLKPNQVIKRINSLTVSDVSTFIAHLNYLNSNRGFVASDEFLKKQYQAYNNKCCVDEEDDDESRLLCFKSKVDTSACLKVREVVTLPSCGNYDNSCVYARSEEEGLSILAISVEGRDVDLLYFGTISQFHSEVIVSDVKVRSWLDNIISLDMVHTLQKLLEYTSALSLGLAVFNLAPVEFLDGAKIYETLFIYYIKSCVTKDEIEQVRNVYRKLLATFKVILILNIIVAFINAFRILI